MTWKNVRLIFLREVRDQLRDRRTLFMVAILPLLLYPALGVGMVQMTLTFSEQTRSVVVLGAADLPPPPLIDPDRPDRFLPRFFAQPDDTEKLKVLTESNVGKDLTTEQNQVDAGMVALGKMHRGEIEELAGILQKRRRLESELNGISRRLETARSAAKGASDSKGESTPPPAPAANALSEQIAAEQARGKEILQQVNADRARETELKAAIDSWFSSSPIQVLIVVPKGFKDQVKRIDEQLEARNGDLRGIDDIPRPILLQNSADEKSNIAYRRIKDALRNWEDELLQSRLSKAGLPSTLISPVNAVELDMAKPNEVAANLWSKLFPAMLIMMGVTGAFYPAIDLGAGEKERGTIETLLISPATRTEIVCGKFLTVLLFSISTALLNLVSMGMTGRYTLKVFGANRFGQQMGDIGFPPIDSLMWVLILAIPLCALFSALSLAIAMYAKSNKEGQYYLTPMLMVVMGLTVFCLSPSIEITPFYSILPVVGPALLLKGLLHNSIPSSGLPYFLCSVLFTSIAYSAAALSWAISLFKREEVLFREAERFDLGLWLKHLMRDKEQTPRAIEAVFCYFLMMILQFISIGALKDAMGRSGSNPDSPDAMMTLQVVSMLVTVLAPPLIMTMFLTTNWRKTLKLYWPKWQYLAIAVVLPLALLPVSVELIRNLEWFFPPTPPSAQKFLEGLANRQVPLGLALLAAAIAPAICEEIAFRGFILSGWQRSYRTWAAIVVSAFAFGIIHMIPQQVFNAILLGLVIGLLAVRSGSLIPGVIFHFLFNGAQVMLFRSKAGIEASDLAKWLDSSMVAQVGILSVCGLISVYLVAWMLRSKSDDPSRRLESGDSSQLLGLPERAG
jgi:sodium transport system permease protein